MRKASGVRCESALTVQFVCLFDCSCMQRVTLQVLGPECSCLCACMLWPVIDLLFANSIYADKSLDRVLWSVGSS